MKNPATVGFFFLFVAPDQTKQMQEPPSRIRDNANRRPHPTNHGGVAPSLLEHPDCEDFASVWHAVSLLKSRLHRSVDLFHRCIQFLVNTCQPTATRSVTRSDSQESLIF